jgi:hypothetical protein
MSRSLLTVALIAAGVVTMSAGSASAGHPYAPPPGFCYPPIQAPLYPSPRPDVPREVGWTLITSPALAPHEMLYPHTYRALYPPYYYCNKCGLSCIPFFPKPCLRGTEVTVKYRSSCWKPPCTRVCYSNVQFK